MHKLNDFLFKTLFLAFFFSGTALANETADINITDVWISEAPPTVSILAAYLNIQNNTNETMTLLSASSPDFSRIEIHRSIIKGEMVSMEKQATIEIPAGETLKLMPGDYHLMLFDPERPLRNGDNATIKLVFADGQTRSLDAQVQKRSGAEHTHHHHH